ncbi:phytanoyl-CoA dioxygenase family protein [Myxococcus sp. K15C18031901]|uniref:phytanoyl-CoA dioxygenase family protein n=1 Tax=Myxococcus dinghuensis TaxID=2906761 RepID=UPI0020A81503|nr:phytanoyl-CoA dioxygenase family protein [Myxococcus dinghuensis]MCP3101658.1 phytanoyl-CoA dioxygenase family protein [Myxococcus dinghuensis]
MNAPVIPEDRGLSPGVRSLGLPSLEEPHTLTQASIETFRRDGHVKLPGVLTAAEIDAYRPHLKRVVEVHSAESHAMERKVAGSGKNWMFVNNLWTRDDLARHFIQNPRLARLAAELLGVEAVRLFRDQSYFKSPGGSNTPWHQDSRFMPLDTDKIVTFWVPLTAITPEMAPMGYVTGSHQAGYLGTSNGDDESMDRFEAELRGKGFQLANYGFFDVGDVAAHWASTLHSSRTNDASILREIVVIVYFADGARVAPEKPLAKTAHPSEFYANVIQRENRATSLPGLKPGELAAGPMTPLVYSRSWDAPRAR